MEHRKPTITVKKKEGYKKMSRVAQRAKNSVRISDILPLKELSVEEYAVKMRGKRKVVIVRHDVPAIDALRRVYEKGQRARQIRRRPKHFGFVPINEIFVVGKDGAPIGKLLVDVVAEALRNQFKSGSVARLAMKYAAGHGSKRIGAEARGRMYECVKGGETTWDTWCNDHDCPTRPIQP